MPRETKYTGVILKKQQFGEADEIITLFTREKGKVRVLAKSVKLQKSKLAGSLQNLFLVEAVVAKSSSRLAKLIGVQVKDNFEKLREDLEKVKLGFYVQELVLKFTADEHKNTKLFDLLLEFFKFLNTGKYFPWFNLGLLKFQIEFLKTVGHTVSSSKNLLESPGVIFSLSRGGFVESNKKDETANRALEQFLELEKNSFNQLKDLNLSNVSELQRLLSEFVKYHLEREVKSEQFLYNNVL